ncbi:MAG: DUF1822 family protein [Geitlerinemataceae cyanobacterium]
MTYSTGHLTISIPLKRADLQIAQRFSQEQPTPEKSQQVYLNTLAVLVVHYYLEMLEIPTNLQSSYSWNPVGRLCADVADIHLPGMGHLECRAIPVGEPVCQVPPEVWHDRLGYVVVQLNRHFSEGTILGFVPTIAQTSLEIDRLQSLDALLVRLYTLESFEVVIPPANPDKNIASNPQLEREEWTLERLPAEENLTRLGQWFDNLFEAGWQAIDDLLGRSPTCLEFRFRSPKSPELANRDDRAIVKRGKSIDLGIQLSESSIVLLVELRQIDNDRVDVCLQVYPSGNQVYLPPNLQFTVKDRSSNTQLQTQSRQADNYIQLRLIADPGDRFSATLSLNNVIVTENFAI